MKRAILLLVLAALAACAPAPRTVPPPALATTATAQRVVMISFDALGYDMLQAHPEATAFAQLEAEGTMARIVTVNPTQTGPAHTAILTGAPPQRSGIVSNHFHRPGTAPDVMASAFSADIDAETLVESARRQGKRVGSICFPTVDFRTPRRSADFGLNWSAALVKSATIHVTRGDFRREWVPPTWTRNDRHTTYSEPMRARLDLPGKAWLGDEVDLVAYDSTDDHVANYDRFYVEYGDTEVTPDDRGWFAVSRTSPDGLVGEWARVAKSDPTLADITIYCGAVSRNEAYPASFREMIDREAGFWPGEPDSHADAVTFADQVDRFADFVARVQVLAIQRMPFDFLLAYCPVIDSAGHRYFGSGAEGDAVMTRAFAAANRDLASVVPALDLNHDAIVVVGDHGLVHLDRELHTNAFLAANGFAPRWRAYASGNVAQFYRFGEPDDTAALVKLLTSTGWFEKIETKTPASHPNSGDVTAFALPNVGVNESTKQPVLAPPDDSGSHGALNTHRELHTVLIAAGAGVPRATLGDTPQTRIAAFVSRLLGIEPPKNADR